MRLGDLDALKEDIKNTVPYVEQERILDIIDNAPTVEPETKLVANVTFNKEQMEELVEKAKADILAQIEIPQGEFSLKELEGWLTSCGYSSGTVEDKINEFTRFVGKIRCEEEQEEENV